MDQVTPVVISVMLLVLGLSYIFRADSWCRLARETIADQHRYFPLMLFVLVLGLTVVVTHNVWVFGLPVIITVLGWVMAIKGALFLITPRFAGMFAGWSDEGMRKYIRVTGGGVTIFAGFLVHHYLIGS